MTENTMADLRRAVARRFRETFHGKEIDTIKKGTPEIEHMLGVVTLGAISTEKCETGTILDPNHAFWQEYYQEIKTENAVRREIETAMQSLRDDDVVRVSEPYGDDAGILYVEVDDLRTESGIPTECRSCGASIVTEPSVSLDYGRYSLVFNLDCPSCDFSETMHRKLNKR